jgi:hypothetical protein
MLAVIADLTRYLYMPSKGITMSITGATTSGDVISTADGQRYLQDAEAKIARVMGDVPLLYTRLSAALAAAGTSISVDTIDTDDWYSTGYLWLNGVNVAYTGATATSFTGLTSDEAIPAAPIGTFVIQSESIQYPIGQNEYKGYESEMYHRLDLICKEAGYNIWVTRFPADAMPKMIDDWKKTVDRELARKASGQIWVRP